MKYTFALVFDAGGRVAQFQLDHPNPAPAAQAAVQTLATLVAEGRSLLDQQQRSGLAVELAVDTKADLRRAIISETQDLARIATVAALRQPEAAFTLAPPTSNSGQVRFLSMARVVLETATAHQALLETYGMADGTLDALGAAISRYEVLVSDQATSRTERVGAVAQLKVLSKEITLVLRQLDVMERRRLRDNAELLAAWKNARDIHWPRPEQKEKTEAA